MVVLPAFFYGILCKSDLIFHRSCRPGHLFPVVMYVLEAILYMLEGLETPAPFTNSADRIE